MKWERAAKPLVWKVTTMQEDMKTPIRSLEYPLGEWKETIANFGDVSAPFDEAGVVARTTSYSPVESAIGGLVHFTRSASPSGCVETVSSTSSRAEWCAHGSWNRRVAANPTRASSCLRGLTEDKELRLSRSRASHSVA